MFYILFRLQVLFNLLIFKTRIIVHLQRLSRDIYLSLKTALRFAFEESLVSFCCCVFHACPLEMKLYGVPGGRYSTKFFTGRLRLA